MHSITQAQARPSGSTPQAQAMQMARADACRLLAACFYPPDRNLFMDENIPEKLGALLKAACPKAALLVPNLRSCIADEKSSVALKVAHTRLFLGPPSMLAPPYASCHMSRNNAVMGPVTVEISKLYNKAGLVMDADFHDMPDHVAVMLEFLYFLLFRETVAASIGNQEEAAFFENMRHRFLDDFMRPWIPKLSAAIREAGEHPFYTALGECVDVFIRHGFEDKAGELHEAV